MYNHTTVTDCLEGLIGFESAYNSDIEAIDEDLLVSSSGLYVNNNLHPLITYENVKAIAENFANVNVRVYSTTATYKKNDIVKVGTTLYQSLQSANTNNAVTNVLFWRTTNLLSAYLRRVYTGSTLKLVNRIFTEKKLAERVKTVLGSVHLYEGVGNITGRITKTGRMVGYKLTIKHQDTIAILSHIGLQLDTVQNPVNIYLYHTSSNVPVKIFVINHTKSIQFQWHEASEILSSLSDTVIGGAYYLAYYEDDLTGSAVKKDISFGSGNCGSCTEVAVNKNLFNKWSQFVSVQPFYVNAADLNVDKSLWNEDKEIFVDNTTWGLNMQFSVQCDVSRVLCQNKTSIIDPLAKQITVDLLQEMAFSMRDNQIKQKVAGLAAAALDNRGENTAGELKNLEKSIMALSYDFSSLSAVCMPCNSAKTKLKSVWG